MISLPHLGYGLAVFYGVLGVVIFRLARKPSCRICGHRGYCPNRLRGPAQITGTPLCARRGESEDKASDSPA
jgi:hypothetical protein